MSDLKMTDTYYCEKCGGVAWGKLTLTSDFQCRCGVPTTFTERQRDEFAVNLLLHIGNMKLSLGKDDKERMEMAQSMIEQYKKTL